MELNWTFSVVLAPYPPYRDGLNCLALHILYIFSECKFFVDALGLFSAQIDGPYLQVYRPVATKGR